MTVWNQFEGPKYHIIGNHDTDGGYDRDQMVDFWKAKGNIADINDFHFVMLDGNEHNESPTRPAGYARYLSEQQLDWLEKDIDDTTYPTIVPYIPDRKLEV